MYYMLGKIRVGVKDVKSWNEEVTNFLGRNFHHYMDVCISNNIGSINYLKCFSIVAIFFGIEIL